MRVSRVKASDAQKSGGVLHAFANYLRGLDNPNPFPGLVALELRTGQPVELRLGGNESLDAPMSALQRAFGTEFCDHAKTYGDPGAHQLRMTLSRIGGFDPEELCADCGADGVIALSLRALCIPGDTVVCSEGTYPTFAYFARAAGCTVIEVPYVRSDEGIFADLERLAEQARRHRARVVYLANPDNPTGSWVRESEVERLVLNLPLECTLLLDEAYIEFCVGLQAGCARAIPSCIRIRSLSKAYGLAGLRVGYALADRPTIEALSKVKVHYALGGLAQHAACLTLEDAKNTHAIVIGNALLRGEFRECLQSLGYRVLPSATNFVSLAMPDGEAARHLQRHMLDHGVAVYRPQHPAMQNLVRITLCKATLEAPVTNLLAQCRR